MSGIHPDGNGRYVPMPLYLEDRRETREALREVITEVKALREESATNLGSQKERRRIAARAAGLAAFFVSLAGVVGKVAGVL